MITSNNDTILESGALEKYASPSITVHPNINPRSGDIRCTLHLAAAGSPSATVSQFNRTFTKADVDAYTGSILLTGDYARFLNALDQAVAAYLLALNPGVTFTVV